MSCTAVMTVTMPVDLFHDLVTATTVDSKTGALTWAAWNARARALLDHPEPHRRWALLILDVDRFAHLNATHGRLAADHVLKAAVAAFSEIITTDGAIGRWGEDEFVLLLSIDSYPDAIRKAEDLRRAVTDLVIGVPTPLGTDMINGVTASIGVTLVESADLTAGLWTADAALYEAKRAGGNTIRTA